MGAVRVTREATITIDEGRRDIDALEYALKQLRETGGAPGNARVTVAGNGPGRFTVNARWTAEDPREAGQDQDQGDRDTPPGFERE